MSKDIRKFDTGATRNTMDGKLKIAGYISPIVEERFAIFMRAHQTQPDGGQRDPDNWQKGIPEDVYFDSLKRHVLDLSLRYLFGVSLEETKNESYQDVLCAIRFNVDGLLFEDLLQNDPRGLIRRSHSLYSKE